MRRMSYQRYREVYAPPECPECGSSDVKTGVTLDDLPTADFGCRDCRHVWDVREE